MFTFSDLIHFDDLDGPVVSDFLKPYEDLLLPQETIMSLNGPEGVTEDAASDGNESSVDRVVEGDGQVPNGVENGPQNNRVTSTSQDSLTEENPFIFDFFGASSGARFGDEDGSDPSTITYDTFVFRTFLDSRQDQIMEGVAPAGGDETPLGPEGGLSSQNFPGASEGSVGDQEGLGSAGRFFSSDEFDFLL